jgi:hypothetical protein
MIVKQPKKREKSKKEHPSRPNEGRGKSEDTSTASGETTQSNTVRGICSDTFNATD